ncbi:platelet glycoprotein V-like [Uranotaenia lowii]|uniref:platelet glycoprotein V-like n=1 Tax=Uranotaenia lowii TaxID=190385 RepID=UPI00247886B9|nr:platelet glycoprotein V-like [Uranotaenia lowii]
MFWLRILISSLLIVHSLAKIHDCNHFLNGVYNIRQCAFNNISVAHDAEEVVFRSEYPRPYFFEFHDSKLTEIPRIMFTSFPEMQNLEVTQCGIENINKYTFEHAKELRYLNLSSNRLTVLNNFIFKGCDKLLRLDISQNQITEIKEKALYDAVKVDHLNLSGNLLSDLDENLFSKLGLLAYLSLANNQISVLHDNLLSNCTSLAFLDLKGNKITSLSDIFLSSLTHLKTLSMDSNRLTALKIPQQLTKFTASNNFLLSIFMDDPTNSQLYTLNLSNNKLRSIENITVLQTIAILDVSFNPIGPLKLTSFLKLKQLTDLNLENTKIATLEHGILAQQSKLRRLDISYNNFRQLDISVLTSTPNLETLYLDGNNLIEMNYEHIPELLPNLTYLGLFANSWNCSYLTTLVRFCNKHQISIAGTKPYGEMSHLTNVQGIYCATSDKDRVYFNDSQAIQHVDKYLSADADRQLEMIARSTTSTDFEYKLVVELLEMIRSVNRSSNGRMDEIRQMALGLGDGKACVSSFHAAGYQVFIMLILTVILVLNVGFLLYVNYNANARRAVDRMIIFKRGDTASIQTQMDDF